MWIYIVTGLQFFKKQGRVESFDTYFQIIFTGTKNRIPQFLKTKIHMKTHCRDGVMQEDTSLPSQSYNIERRVSRFSQIYNHKIKQSITDKYRNKLLYFCGVYHCKDHLSDISLVTRTKIQMSQSINHVCPSKWS